MRIAYCSLLLPEEKRLSERAKERLSGISGHKVTKAVIYGIDSNIEKPVDVFNIINTLNYPKFPQIIFRSEEWNHTNIDGHKDYHLGYINLFGIKYITQYQLMRKALTKWIKQSEEPGIICVHSMFLPLMAAAIDAVKTSKGRIKLCLNTGDIPGKYGLVSQYRKNIKQILTEEIVNKKIFKLVKRFDCFVFVTKNMAEALEVKDKPFTVIECTYLDPPYAKDIILTHNKKKQIFYAGALRLEYGIDHLLRAFSMIYDSDYRLVIAGGGACEDLVKEYSNRDERIVYLGFITPQSVLKYQKESSVIVSPRKSDLDFVKYSFPSKSVDSLASGIPYVAHKLPCDPPEYEDYINYAKDESDEALRDKMIEICEMTDEERAVIGKKARDFIVQQKNPEIMTRRIVTMWEDVIDQKE